MIGMLKCMHCGKPYESYQLDNWRYSDKVVCPGCYDRLDVLSLCECAVREWKTRRPGIELLKLICWDKKEADAVREEMKKYPDVKFILSYHK